VRHVKHEECVERLLVHQVGEGLECFVLVADVEK
jgi:hypothetical protein